MEPFEGWERGPGYEDLKKERSAKLYEALERVIPDIRERVVLEMVGSPLTHQHWMRRYKGEEFRLKKGRKKKKKIVPSTRSFSFRLFARLHATY